MNGIKKIWTVAIFLAVFSSVFCAEKKSSEMQPRFALVIGNQNYEQGKLDNPIEDAKLMKKVLEDCCFDVSFYVDLTKDGIEAAILDYTKKVNAAGSDVISFFYYSGHGVQIDGENYIVPINDKDIDSEISAKMKCFGVNKIFDFVKATTQVFVLDACRNNPFSNKKQNISKGLSPIKAPSGIKFLYLFSTQAGETAEDGGSGKNSLFTSILAKELKETNIPIDKVFSNVSIKVTDMSGDRQKPLYTGSSVDFEMMNEAVASWKLAQLKARAAELKTALKSENSDDVKKSYTTEENLIAVQIKYLEEKKEESKKDAAEKAKNQKEADERSRELAKETEKTRKEAELLKRKAQENRAKERSSYDFLAEIEKNKQRLQEIRTSAYNHIVEANLQVEKEADEKIEEIKKIQHSPIDYDGKGRLTKEAKKEQDEKIKKVNDELNAKRAKNLETYKAPIVEEEKDLLEQIDLDFKTLKGAKYWASSYIDELKFNVVNQYDGEKHLWVIRIESSLFNYGTLINEKIEVPYSKLGKSNEAVEIYRSNVELYDSLLRVSDNSPFEVRAEYTLKPMENRDSTYLFTGTEISVWYNDSEGEEICLNRKNIKSIHEIRWEQSTKLQSIEEMIDSYYKTKFLEDKKQELIKKGKSTKESINTGLSNIEEWGGEQLPIEGFVFALGGGNQMFTADLGWSFPLGGNFFVGPALILGGGKTDSGLRKGAFGIAGFTGFCFTYNIDEFAIRPYVYTALRLDTLSRFGWNTCFGCEYVYKNEFSVGANFGFDLNAENKFGVLFAVETTVPLETFQNFIN